MKIMAFLLAFFLLGLAIVPCADNLPQSNIEQVSDSHSDHNHDADSDLCSPFCVCHCCHTHFVVNQSLFNGEYVAPYLMPESNYIESAPSGFANSLLQPPQA